MEPESKPETDKIAEATPIGVTHGGPGAASVGSELPPPSGRHTDQQPPPGWREIIAVLLLVVVCDLTIYRGQGFAGYALLFVVAPALLALGCVRPRFCGWVCMVGIMLVLLATKLLWCGDLLQVTVGFALLIAFAMALAGQRPYVLETLVFASQTIRSGYEGLIQYARRLNRAALPMGCAPWLSVMLPLAAFVLFSLIFILANPDVFASVWEGAELAITRMREWLLKFSPTEVLFWLAVVWISVGMLRPAVGRRAVELASSAVAVDTAEAIGGQRSFFYAAFRNTLITVIALFAVYLVFEFKTLWFRTFPEGFYYAGYAHEGAAWLTLALALATAILSLIFRGSILQDARLPHIRRLAWLWSLENFLLAVAVYNRLFIYIGFNGLTRLRMVGLFGITTVVVGFVLVLYKIAYNRNFAWLIRGHLWTLALAIYLYALTPVDTLVVSYNVRRILAGDPKPSVQILAQPIRSEAVLLLQPLLNSQDATISEGVRAYLAQRDDEAEAIVARQQQLDWTAYQLSDQVALERLRAARDEWAEFKDRAARDEALRRFHEYAYQWY